MPALHCRLQSASSQLSSQPRSIRPLAAAAAPRRPQRSNTRPATAAAPLLFSLIRARAAAQSSSSDSSLQYGGEEKVLDIQLLLLQEVRSRCLWDSTVAPAAVDLTSLAAMRTLTWCSCCADCCADRMTTWRRRMRTAACPPRCTASP